MTTTLDRSAAEVDAWVKQRGSTWVPVDLGQFLAGDDQDERPSVLAREDGSRLLYSGRLNAFNAEPESIKTWLALRAAADELRVGNVVVYLDFEDSPRAIVERLRALGVTDELIAEQFIYVQPTERIELGRAELEAALARKPTLVVIDGVTEAMTLEGLSLKDNSEVAEFYERLPRRVARRGPAVLLLDHVVKATDNRGRFAIGAQSKLAGIDGASYAVKMTTPFGRGRIGHANLYLTKDRLGWIDAEGKNRLVATIEVLSAADGTVDICLKAPVASEDFRPTVLMERVSLALENRTTEGANWHWIQKHVTGKNEWKHLALNVLVNEGYVAVESGNHKALIHRSVRPYREADDAGDKTPADEA